jgi:phage shock protein C
MATYSPAKNSAATWGSGVKGSDMDQTRKLYRSQTDRKLAGVCGGLADYLKLDAIIIRVGFVVLTVLGGAGIPIYLAMWLLIPKQAQSVAVGRSER